MLKIAILVWLMLATVFAGAAVLTVLSLPALGGQDMRLIPIVAGVGALAAVPFALIVAKRILALTATKA